MPPPASDRNFSIRVAVKGTFLGGFMGVLCGGNGYCLAQFVRQGPQVSWLENMVGMGTFGIVGGLVSAAILTIAFHWWTPRFQSRRAFVAAGTTAGLPFGLLNMFVLISILGPPPMSILLLLAIPGVATGLGIGLGAGLVQPFAPRRDSTDDVSG